jgi:hypothetical protein
VERKRFDRKRPQLLKGAVMKRVEEDAAFCKDGVQEAEAVDVVVIFEGDRQPSLTVTLLGLRPDLAVEDLLELVLGTCECGCECDSPLLSSLCIWPESDEVSGDRKTRKAIARHKEGRYVLQEADTGQACSMRAALSSLISCESAEASQPLLLRMSFEERAHYKVFEDQMQREARLRHRRPLWDLAFALSSACSCLLFCVGFTGEWVLAPRPPEWRQNTESLRRLFPNNSDVGLLLLLLLRVLWPELRDGEREGGLATDVGRADQLLPIPPVQRQAAGQQRYRERAKITTRRGCSGMYA